jgi:hypothetical protein
MNPEAKVCPTYDIDVVWHAHLSTPHQYKGDTELLIGAHLGHDDSVSDRGSGAVLGHLQASTKDLFRAEGLHIFQPGGMYRGEPFWHPSTVRDAALPGML